MRLIFMGLLCVVAFVGCLNSDKNGDSNTSAPANIQDWLPLTSISSTEMLQDTARCGDWDGFNPAPIRYRLRGDSLDVGWAFFSYETIDSGDGISVMVSASDTSWFGGTYVRVGNSTSSAIGRWRLVDHRPWEEVHADDSALIGLPELWDYLYEGEEAWITPRSLSFSYPDVRIWGIKQMEFEMGDDMPIAVQYVGTDSLRVTRDGETASIKSKPFKFVRANSSVTTRSAINVSFTDSCDHIGAVIDSTWLYDVVFGEIEEDFSPVIFLEKSARSGAVRRGGGRLVSPSKL